MAHAFTPGLAAQRKTVIRRVRELPVKGEILCSLGDKVEAHKIVARAELPGEMHILRLPESMGLSVEEVVAGLRVKEGDMAASGAVLCEHIGLFGLFKSEFKSPESGLVEVVSHETGHICLRLAPKAIELNAYLSGTVVGIDPGKSVTVEATGAFIQGIFGVGGERHGKIKILNARCDEEVQAQHIADSCRGEILIGGARPSSAALQRAAELGACGLVTGSIDDAVLARYLGYDLGIALTGDEDISMTVIITEGFGMLPFSQSTFDLLKEFDGSTASINGATQVRAGALRPEIIIPSKAVGKSAETQSAPGSLGLAVGSRIRVIRHPHFGSFATVSELPKEAEKIDSGAHTRVLRAKLDSGKIVTVPRANVELVG